MLVSCVIQGDMYLLTPSPPRFEHIIMPETFGEWLKQNRDARGLSQRLLGARSGVSDAIISFLEKGKRKPSRDMIISLATALEIDAGAGLLLAGFMPENTTVAESQSAYVVTPERRQVELVKLRGQPVYGLIPEDATEQELREMRRALEIALRQDS